MRRLQKRLYLVAALILLVGWGSAFVLYLRARAVSESDLVSEYENSKRFRHDLETYGGTLNVLADQLLRWWDSLWQGTTLPLTIACLTAFIVLVIVLIAYRWPSDAGTPGSGPR